MDRLFFITPELVDRVVESIDLTKKNEIFPYLRTTINEIPVVAPTLSYFIVKCCRFDNSYKEFITEIFKEEPTDYIADISRSIYAVYLGAKVDDALVFPKYSVFDSVTHPSPDYSLIDSAIQKVYPNRADTTLLRFPVFVAHSIIQKMVYNKHECLYRLKKLTDFEIIVSMLIKCNMADISMAVFLSKNPKFLNILLDYIDLFDERPKILSLIFSSYYISSNELVEDVLSPFDDSELFGKFRSCFDDEVLEHSIRICNREALSEFLGRHVSKQRFTNIPSSEFITRNFKSKHEFWNAFIEAASPTPTHFLSYLEYFKDRFVLSEEEQVTFVKMLQAYHKDNPVYLDVVLNKMIKFNIIRSKLIKT